MSSELLEELVKKSEELTPSERLLLAARVIEAVRLEIPPRWRNRHYRWTDARGLLPYPALGEDAQAYITRTRQEETERRADQINPSS